MQKDRPILVRVHPDFAQARANLLGDDIGDVGVSNPAIAAQQIEGEEVRDPRAIRKTTALDPGYPSGGKLAAELGDEPRLADAGLADETNRLAAPVFNLPKDVVQDRELAFAIDKIRRARRRRFAQPGAPM